MPVPKILAWSVDADTNPVGAEYMVMEAVSGVPLQSLWSRMNGLQHIQCIVSIGKLAKDLYSLEFVNFGSLYFDTRDRPAGAISLGQKYCIGPNCARQHWGYNQAAAVRYNVVEGRQGPCKSACSQIVLLSQTEPPQGMTQQHTSQTLSRSPGRVFRDNAVAGLSTII